MDMNDPSFLQMLPPDLLRRSADLSNAVPQENILEEQLAQANALRNAGGERHSTGLGGLFGALGQGLNSLNGTLQTNNLRQKQQEQLGGEAATRAALMRAYVEALRRAQAQPQPEPTPSGMNDGGNGPII